MATTAIIINSTDGFGKSAQKAMTCVNPDATNAELATLGQMITAAQNHTYGNTVRVDKTDCDTEASIPPKPTPTFSASITQWSAATFSNQTGPMRAGTTSALTYDGDGDFFVSSQAIQDGLGVEVWKVSNKISFRPFYYDSLQPTFPYTFKVGFTETENYKACSVDITITA